MTLLRNHRCIPGLALVLIAFPVMAADPMCTAIQQFAEAQMDTVPHSVELLTNWMPSADVLSSKECLDQDYPPGKRLCQYLLKNAATEFPEDNLSRALLCISNGPYTGPKDVLVELLHVRYFSPSIPGVSKRVGVTLEFNRDGNGPPSLKITTDRSRD